MRQQARIILTAMMSMIRTTTPEKKIIYQNMLRYKNEIKEIFLLSLSLPMAEVVMILVVVHAE
jgi:hypothetical protein